MKEKTEKPTDKRQKEARKEGQVPKSKEIVTAVTTAGLVLYFWIFFPHYMEQLKKMLLLPTTLYRTDFEHAYLQCIQGVFKTMTLLSVPFALTGFALVVLAHIPQFGLIFAVKPITPDAKKINPVEGFKRIFSLDSLIEVIKSVLKICLISVIVYLLIKENISSLVYLPRYEVAAILPILSAILKKLLLLVLLVFILTAVLDYFLQKQLHLRKLKMDIDEIKKERKDTDGDPHIKSRRNTLHREIINDDMVAAIRDAAVIISYGRKIAVAVHYRYGRANLPVVTLKSRKAAAVKTLLLAGKFGIPVFPDPFLARKLMKSAKLKTFIPRDLLEPIALVLRSVRRPDQT